MVFFKKNERAIAAEKWHQKMEKTYLDETESSVKRTLVILDDTRKNHPLVLRGMISHSKSTEIEILPHDSLYAIFRSCYPEKRMRTAILNFASFTHPGGGFLKGATAQEESLCGASNLYSILSRHKDFYKKNKRFKNYGLYVNAGLYIPDVCFFKKKVDYYAQTTCDVISCAAPNMRIADLHGIPENEELHAMIQRIDFVLGMGFIHGVDHLILGAFGCGAFQNNAIDVAKTFNILLHTKYENCFTKVTFAIPSDDNAMNYYVFKNHIKKDLIIDKMGGIGEFIKYRVQ